MTEQDCPEKRFSIGSIVRAPRISGQAKPLGKAMVAMVLDEGDEPKLAILWEPAIARPLAGLASFALAPNIAVSTNNEEQESLVAVSSVEPLQEFELDDGMSQDKDAATYKSRADQLLRLGDPTSAISYYDAALSRVNQVSVGSTIIVSVQGFPKLAEVDCIEDDGILEIVWVESGEDATFPKSEILLAVLENDANNLLQVRILLNLARCLIQQGDIDRAHKSNYLSAAGKACTLVLTLLEFHQPELFETSELYSSALQLRISAYKGLSKWAHAMADAKRLRKLGHSKGEDLLQSVQAAKQRQQKQDKKLVKAMSKLVQTATTESVSDKQGPQSNEDPVVHVKKNQTKTSSPNEWTRLSTSFPPNSYLIVFLIALAAFLINRWKVSYDELGH